MQYKTTEDKKRTISKVIIKPFSIEMGFKSIKTIRLISLKTLEKEARKGMDI